MVYNTLPATISVESNATPHCAVVNSELRGLTALLTAVDTCTKISLLVTLDSGMLLANVIPLIISVLLSLGSYSYCCSPIELV